MLGLLSAGHQARHLGLLWIATEAITLATVPLLHFNGTPRAFEATWKYLLVGGTGIALSLLGSFCLGYASLVRRRRRRSDLHRAGRARRGLVASVGADRVGVAARRLRHQNGSGADAHLEARRLRRSAGHRRRAAGGRRDHGGVHRHPARAFRGRGAGAGAMADRTLLAIGLVFDAGRRAVSAGHARLQTDAGVFKRRAHGHSGRRRGARRRGRRRRRCFTSGATP